VRSGSNADRRSVRRGDRDFDGAGVEIVDPWST
jgi:hypothetical protein